MQKEGLGPEFSRSAGRVHITEGLGLAAIGGMHQASRIQFLGLAISLGDQLEDVLPGVSGAAGRGRRIGTIGVDRHHIDPVGLNWHWRGQSRFLPARGSLIRETHPGEFVSAGVPQVPDVAPLLLGHPVIAEASDFTGAP